MRDRAVSTAVGHVLAIGITTLLISGLLVAGSNFLASQQEISTEESLRIEGSQLASQITVVDQSIQSAMNEGTVENLTVVVALPDRIVGSSYTVVLSHEGDCDGATAKSIACLELTSQTNRGTVTERIPFRNVTSVRETSINGGPLVIRGNSSAIWITEAAR